MKEWIQVVSGVLTDHDYKINALTGIVAALVVWNLILTVALAKEKQDKP